MHFGHARAAVVTTALFLLAGAAGAADLRIGQQAPDFSLPDQSGKIHRLADYRGKTVVLAFYPKDFTGGCTCEVEALRDSLNAIQSRNAVVFGVSADTVDSHAKFAEQYNLQYPLLADPERKMIEAYGALGPNNVAHRYTFIIGPDGTIKGIDRAVNAQFDKVGDKLTSRHGQNLALLLSGWKAKVGSPVPNFSLPAYDGQAVTPLAPGKKATVVVFMSTGCPVSRAYEKRLTAMAARYPDVMFLGVASNHDEPQAQVREHMTKSGIPFPVAIDSDGSVAQSFAARATPTAWVIDAKGVAVYRGAVDDNQDEAKVAKTYLTDALEAVLAGKPVPVADTQAFGCAIRLKK